MYVYVRICMPFVCMYVCIACMHICKNVCKYLRISMYYTLLSSTAVTGAQLDDKDYEGSRSRAHHSQSNTHCIV